MSFFRNLFRSTPSEPVKPVGLEHFCVPSAIKDAWTWEIRTHRPSRIIITKFNTAGDDHAQAEGQEEDGSWTPLTTHNTDGGTLLRWVRHYSNEPYKYWTLDDFIKSQSEVRRAHTA